MPYAIPTAQPMTSANRWNHRVYRPTTIAGKICAIQIPPSSCRLIENVLFSASTKASAPTFMTSEASRATRVSSAGVAFGRRSSLYTLRVNRFAVAIDMMAAGTSAPMTIAA